MDENDVTRTRLGLLDHLPRALWYANERAERWRRRYLKAVTERDDFRAQVKALAAKWENTPRGTNPLHPRLVARELNQILEDA